MIIDRCMFAIANRVLKIWTYLTGRSSLFFGKVLYTLSCVAVMAFFWMITITESNAWLQAFLMFFAFTYPFALYWHYRDAIRCREHFLEGNNTIPIEFTQLQFHMRFWGLVGALGTLLGGPFSFAIFCNSLALYLIIVPGTTSKSIVRRAIDKVKSLIPNRQLVPSPVGV